MNRQVIGLDVIRFASALLVVAYHFGFIAAISHPDFPHNFTLLEPYTCYGFIGVDIFFVLSGIVIAYSAEHSTALRFAISRLLRLYPAVWICSTVTLLVLLRFPHKSIFFVWFNSMVLSPFKPWIDLSYWTLGIEMSFYLLIFILLLGKRFRYLAPVMTLISLLSSAAIFYFSHLVDRAPTAAGSLSAAFMAHYHDRITYLLLVHHGPLFALGVLLWLGFYHRFNTPRLVCLAITLAGSLLAVHTDSAELEAIFHYRFSATPAVLIWVGAMTGIVLSLVYNQQIAHAVGPRGASFARAAGLATYPLYLVHQQVGDIVVHRLANNIPYPAAMALCFTALLAFSFAVVPYVEKPLQNFLKRFLHRPSQIVQPAASLP